MQQLFRGGAGYIRAERRAHLGRQFDAARSARPDAAASRNQPLVVVVPRTARQREHALAFRERGRQIRRRIKEDVPVIEGREQAYLARQQQTVAEHIARHVAHAGHADRRRVQVMPEFIEMPLDGFPGALGRDAELLVIVAIRAAGGERIAEPESARHRDAVGNVGKGGRTLVGGHHQIRIGFVVADRLRRHEDVAQQPVVGQVQQSGDEQPVDRLALGGNHLARGFLGNQFADETALGACRHDDRVLDHLRLDQAQHFGAVILHPVGPAQAATRHRAAAQMHAFEAARENIDFAERPWLRQERKRSAVELEDHRVAALRILEIGGAQGCQHQVGQAFEDVFGIGVIDRAQILAQRFDGGSAGGTLLGGERRVEARQECADQRAHRRRLLLQAIGHVAQAEAATGLAPVTGIGADHLHFARAQAGLDHQRVHAAVLGLVIEQQLEHLLRRFGHPHLRQARGAVLVHRQAGDEEIRIVRSADPMGLLAVDRHTGILQRRQDGRQRWRTADRQQADFDGAVQSDFDMHPHPRRFAQRQKIVQVAIRRGRCRIGHVIGRQGGAELAHRCALRDVHAGFDQVVEGVRPAFDGGQQRLLEIDVERQVQAGVTGDQVDARQRTIGQQGLHPHLARPREAAQTSSQGRRQRFAVAFARQIDQQVQMAAVDIAAGEYPGPRLLVEGHHGTAKIGQEIGIGFEDFGARQGFQDLQEFLGPESFLAHAGNLHHLRDAAAHERQLRQRRHAGRAREQTDETMLADDGATGVRLPHADEVQVLVAVQGRLDVCLDHRQRTVAPGERCVGAGYTGQAAVVDRMTGVAQDADAALEVARERRLSRRDPIERISECDKTALARPLEERGRFQRIDGLRRIGRRRCAAQGRHCDQAFVDGSVVAPNGGSVGCDLAHRVAQSGLLGGRQFLLQQAQHEGFERIAAGMRRLHFADALVGIATHRQDSVQNRVRGDVQAAHRHDDRIDQERHVGVVHQERRGPAAAAIGIAQRHDLTGRRLTIRHRRETLPQDRRQAGRRDFGQILWLQRRQPGLDQGQLLRHGTGNVGGVALKQSQRFSANVERLCGHLVLQN